MHETNKMDIVAKILSIATVVLLICALASVVLYLLMPALAVAEDTFVGWEVSFYGPAENFAYGQYNFGYNVTAIVALAVGIVAAIATLIAWRRAHRVGKCIFGALTFAAFLFLAVVLLSIGELAESVASPSMGATIGYARADGVYHIMAVPVIAAIVCLLTATAGAANIAVGVCEKLGIVAVKETAEDDEDDEADEDEQSGQEKTEQEVTDGKE